MEVAVKGHTGWCECLRDGVVWGHHHWLRGLGFQEEKFLGLSPEDWTELESVKLVSRRERAEQREVRK